MIKILLSHLTVTILLLGSACSACVFTGEPPVSLSETAHETEINRIMATARIQQSLQLNVLQNFLASDAHTMVALFSESGYADRGQTVVLIDSKFSHGMLQLYPPNRQHPDEAVVALTKSQLDELQQLTLKALDLDDYEKPSFDGVVFEYLYLTQNSDSSLFKKRLYMQSLGLPPGSSPQHEALVDGLLGLR